MIDYEKLQGLLGAGSYDQLRRSHKGWVEEHLGDGAKERQDEWTGSVAVGSKSFIESVKASLGFRAKGRDVIQSNKGYQLRESPAPYKSDLGGCTAPLKSGRLPGDRPCGKKHAKKWKLSSRLTSLCRWKRLPNGN